MTSQTSIAWKANLRPRAPARDVRKVDAVQAAAAIAIGGAVVAVGVAEVGAVRAAAVAADAMVAAVGAEGGSPAIRFSLFDLRTKIKGRRDAALLFLRTANDERRTLTTRLYIFSAIVIV